MHTYKIMGLILILLAIIIGASIFSSRTLASSSKRIENQVIEIQNSTKAGNWKKAESGLIAVKKDWNGTSDTWAALIDHIELDNIDESLSKMEKYIVVKDTSMALAEAATLGQLIKHIPEKDAFSLKNIL